MKFRAFVVLLISLILPFSALALQLRIEMISDYRPTQTEAPSDIATQLLIKTVKSLDGRMDIDFVAASREREWRELQYRDNVCLYNKVKTTERMKVAHFSAFPLIAFPANRLILRNHKFMPTELSLAEALKQGLKIGVTRGRSYGKEIDNLIQKHKHELFIGEGENSAYRLRKMLVQGRLDGIIEYTSVFVTDYQQPDILENISYHQLKDVPSSIFGYIACSNSETGLEAIKLFNRILQERTLLEKILDTHKKLFLPEERPFIIEALKLAYNIQ